MTEKEWLNARDPFTYTKGITPKQRRLFTCACCHRIWHLLTDQRSKTAVEVSERFAYRKASQEELTIARDNAWQAYYACPSADTAAASHAQDIYASRLAVAAATTRAQVEDAIYYGNTYRAERLQQVKLLQDIVGNPFRPMPRQPLTNNIKGLAKEIFEKQDYSLLPILADALREADCDQAMIDHCSEPNHVLGCWLIDFILDQ